MASAFSNGLKRFGSKIVPPEKPVNPMIPPKQFVKPVAPVASPMTVPAQPVQQQVPAVTPQPVQQPAVQSTQGSLVKDVLRRKRMLEI